MKDIPILALKSFKGEGVFRIALLWQCFELPFCLFGFTRNTSVIYEKAKSLLFYLYATAKLEIHICSNKHETGLLYCINNLCDDFNQINCGIYI